MVKHLVICSDGTGNTFDQRQSNVSQLVRALDLTPAARQIVVYDQGLGTNPGLVTRVERFRDDHGLGDTLVVPPAPTGRKLPYPVAVVAGLAAGYGLRENVAQLYRALAAHYQAEDTRIWLFGFSRGAFTVRVLAGLLYRCGLPPRDIATDPARFAACFAAVWTSYLPHAIDARLVDQARSTHALRDVEVHFLGLWDTVKSYGGLRPLSLPHLRHNPIVARVCHALALDERRSWFRPTTWGGLDIDRDVQAPVPPDPRYAGQCVQEVWFRGCHSDIGGGNGAGATPRVAFRWMLGEATDEEHGLRLRADADAWIFAPGADDPVPPPLHESATAGWRLSDWIPRWELDNGSRPPRYPLRWPGRGARQPEEFRRHQAVTLHASTGLAEGPGLHIVASKTPQAWPRPAPPSGLPPG